MASNNSAVCGVVAPLSSSLFGRSALRNTSGEGVGAAGAPPRRPAHSKAGGLGPSSAFRKGSVRQGSMLGSGGAAADAAPPRPTSGIFGTGRSATGNTSDEKRRLWAMTLLHEEMAYCEKLSLLMELYIDPLIADGLTKKPRLLPRNPALTIFFHTVEHLRTLNEGFLKVLEDKASGNPPFSS